jgi:hypothetical protein
MLERKIPKSDSELAGRIWELRKQGHSYGSIKAELGVSFATIRNAEKVQEAPGGITGKEQAVPKPYEQLEKERLRSLPIKEEDG